MRKSLLSLFSLFMLATTVLAQGVPFRRHRYDGFKTHKLTSENIVFLGNSITNMHEWWEAFGNANIVNRGVNGAETPIMLEHLEATLAGRPKKIFFMMGTNDLGTRGMNDPAFVAKSVRTALKRCKNESPETEIYFQSILPCTTNGVKDVKHIPITNDSIKKLCQEYGATYIDLYDDLTDIANMKISYDGTHLTMSGYRTWCNKIAQYVGSDCVYPADAQDVNGGNGGIAGMRTTYFNALPIKVNDILILGEDGNDWHELLHSNHVKQRGTSWGYKSNDLGTMQKMLQSIFKGRSDNAEPKMVCLVLGYNEINNTGNGSKTVDAIVESYKAFVNKVRELAPNTAIRLMAVIPSDNADVNKNRTIPFNEKLQAMAAEMQNVTYCADSYTLLVGDNGAIKDAYFPNFSGARYMSGLGYAKLSQAMANAIGTEDGVTPTTDEEAAEGIATFDARNTLYNAIATAEKFPVGANVGQYLAADVTPLTEGIKQGYELLAKESATNEELKQKGGSYAELVNKVLPNIIKPTLSTDKEEHWYQLYTPNRENRYATSYGDGEILMGDTKTAYAKSMWKFVARTDNTWDIVNRADGTYINPASAYNNAIKTTATKPAKGWTLSYSNAIGTFIISSDNVELNQTPQSLDYKIYNWSIGKNGQDRADAGCQFAIVDAPAVENVPETFLKGDVEISTETGALNSGTYGTKWTSTRTAPQLTLNTGKNDIWQDTNDKKSLILYVGSGVTTTTHTLKVSDNYEITGISAWVKSNESGKNVTIKVGDSELTTSDTEQKFEVANLSSNSVEIVLSGNRGAVFKNFIVSVQKKGYIEEDFEYGDIDVSMSSGTMNGGTTNGIRYGSIWTSTRTAPQLKLAIGPNNIWIDKTDNVSLTLLTGAAKSVDYTLSVTSGYEITAVSMKGEAYAPAEGDLQITVGKEAQTLPAKESKLLQFNGLKDNSVKLTVAGELAKNKGVIARDFKVTVQKVGYVPPTSIATVQPTTKNQPTVIYDLSGRRAKNATKGVFIINGKKVIK